MPNISERRVLSLFLPRWPIDRRFGRAARPDRPFVLATTVGGRRIITAANGLARAEGISPGMGLADARALEPSLVIGEADFVADAAALTRLAQWCDRFSPWTVPCGADGIFLDITGCAHLFGDEAGLAAQAVARLERQGIECRAAIADTPGAAWALSRFSGSRFSGSRFSGSRCGGKATVNVAPGMARPALAPLPVEALRLEPDILALLLRLGIQRIGELYPIPRAALAARFGDVVALRLDQALGAIVEPLSPLPPAPLRWSRRSFAEPIATPEAIAAALRELLQHLCRRFGEEGMGARQLALALYRVDGRVERAVIGTAFASRDPRHLWRLFEERLPAIDPGLGIEDMVLMATRADRLAPEQRDLGGGMADGADLAALVDRLAARLGPQALARPVLRESHIPERAVRFVAPLAEPKAPAVWDQAKPRPIRLLPRPEAIAVTALLPDDPPAMFTWRRRLHRVRHADGPERIADEWWRAADEQSAERDYYRVENEDGCRFWVYRDQRLLSQKPDAPLQEPPEIQRRWFLHGFFD